MLIGPSSTNDRVDQYAMYILVYSFLQGTVWPNMDGILCQCCDILHTHLDTPGHTLRWWHSYSFHSPCLAALQDCQEVCLWLTDPSRTQRKGWVKLSNLTPLPSSPSISPPQLPFLISLSPSPYRFPFCPSQFSQGIAGREKRELDLLLNLFWSWWHIPSAVRWLLFSSL